MKDKLSQRQKRFAAEIAAGKTQAEAYTAAGYSRKQGKHTIEQNAFILAHNEKVMNEIARLQRLADDHAILSRDQRLALLTSFALNADGETGKKDRLRALEIIAKMSGDYSETIRADVSAVVETDRAAAVAEALRRLTS